MKGVYMANNGSEREPELPINHATQSEKATSLSEEDLAELNEKMADYAYHAKGLSSAKSKILHLINGGRFTVEQQRLLNGMDTGIDSTKADVGALVQLLVEKGVFTQLEFFEVASDFMAREAQRARNTVDHLEGTATRVIVSPN